MQPMDAFVPAEPGQLPFGIAAGFALDVLGHLIPGARPLKIGNPLFVADRLPRCRSALGERLAGFLLQACIQHLVYPAVDPGIKLVPVEKIQADHAGIIGRRLPAGVRNLLGHGLAGCTIDLNCADHPSQVVRMKARRRLRVNAPQLVHQNLDALLFCAFLERRAQSVVAVFLRKLQIL